MKALVEFISQYEPRYAEIVQGVPPEKIDKLEAVLGRTLPTGYRDFLATAGKNIGFPTGEINFDIDELIDLVTDRSAPLPENLIPIALDEGASFFDYYLDLSHSIDSTDALVIRMCGGNKNWRIPEFWSLRDMLFSWAFKDVRMAKLRERTQLIWTSVDIKRAEMPQSLEILRSVMIHLGFEPLTVTGPDAQLYERGDCAGWASRTPFRQSFSIILAARDRQTLRHVVEVLSESMPTQDT